MHLSEYLIARSALATAGLLCALSGLPPLYDFFGEEEAYSWEWVLAGVATAFFAATMQPGRRVVFAAGLATVVVATVLIPGNMVFAALLSCGLMVLALSIAAVLPPSQASNRRSVAVTCGAVFLLFLGYMGGAGSFVGLGMLLLGASITGWAGWRLRIGG